MPLRKTDAWIDQFQQEISFPVAARVAMFARVPLIGAADLARMHEPKINVMTVALGPFHVHHDAKWTMWQPFWVSVIEAGAPFGNVIASPLCIIDSRTGHGGFRYVRVWDMFKQAWVYWGDHEHQIHWGGIVKIITDHLASQYHVGFVEDPHAAGTSKQHLDASQQLWEDEAERQKQIDAEQNVQATKL